MALAVVVGLLAVSAALAGTARAEPPAGVVPSVDLGGPDPVAVDPLAVDPLDIAFDVQAVSPGAATGDQIDDQYVVAFGSAAGHERAMRAVAGRGVDVVEVIGGSGERAVVRAEVAVADALRRHPDVVAVEPNRVLHLLGAPAPVSAVPGTFAAATVQGDPPWGLDRVDQRELPLSGTYTAPSSGADVIAYVIDDGIWREHVDFGERVLPGAALVGLDEPDQPSTDSHPTCSKHGSHIAGTIGGTFAGLAKQIQLVPVRVFDCDGRSSTAAVVAAMDWVRTDAGHPAGVPGIVNLSFGGPPSEVIDAEVQQLADAGFVVVAAAGNSSADACNYSPARSSAAVTVGSTTITDVRSWFSNIGPCVDLFAPGSSILSVDADGTSSGFTTMSGTSMATPHVAGAAAMLLSLQHDLTPAEVSQRLVGDATTNVIAEAGAGSPNRLLHVGALDGSDVDACCDPPPPDAPPDPGPSGPAPAPSGEPSTGPVPPANDAFADAEPLPVETGSVTGTNVAASAEPGEPDHAGTPGGASVWWRFTAPSGGTMTLSTDGSDFDTLLAVYTGSSVASLDEVAAAADTPGIAPQSEITFPVVAGATYRVAVDGRAGETGSIVLGATWHPGFVGLGPERAFDSRVAGRPGAGEVTVVPLTDLPSDATGVVLNVTAVEAAAAGFVTVFPCVEGAPDGGSPPEASNLNVVAGQTVPNAVVSEIGVGPGGVDAVCAFTSVETDLLVDVSGALRSGFTGLRPERVLDTRVTGRAAAGSVTVVPVAGRAGVPSVSSGVVLNVTAVEAAAAGFVTVFPCVEGAPDGGSPPEASNLNVVEGQTVPNAVVSEIGAAGEVCVFTSVEADLLVDVTGAFGSGFDGVGPERVFDSRPSGRIPAGDVVIVPVAGTAGVPSDAAAVVLNVTAVEADAAGFVTVFPCVGPHGGAPPEASNLNVVAGQTVPNAVVTEVGDAGTVCLFTSVETDLLVDLAAVLR